MRLYSYCIPVDDGAAPNPYWGKCTLAICKPAIRRTATSGDWVVGVGSKKSPIGDISGQVVYAMEVSEVMTMREYDQWTTENLPNKIPDLKSQNYARLVGDSIYRFGSVTSKKGRVSQRPSVHGKLDQKRDLSGCNVLLSDHFFYFGDKPVVLPKELMPIVHQTQGHKVRLNHKYRSQFVDWIEQVAKPGIHGDPATNIRNMCARTRARCIRENDERTCSANVCALPSRSSGYRKVLSVQCR